MNKGKFYFYGGLIILLLIGWFFSQTDYNSITRAEDAKITLRTIGHQLLLSNKDSVSIVSPVIELDVLKYQLSFQNDLSIEPDSLISIVKRSFQGFNLSEYYIVEVLQCSNGEVVYSYKMRNEKDKNIIPCRGRNLPKSCYDIEIKLIDTPFFIFNKRTFLYSVLLVILLFLTDFIIQRKKSKPRFANSYENNISIGVFLFYPTQNILIKEAVEIALSQKECELLSIFVTNLNQVVRREELTKKVWEDNGVIVGRSLDTYISKLRKKLKDDASIRLTNVHGVGYKLEIDN